MTRKIKLRTIKNGCREIPFKPSRLKSFCIQATQNLEAPVPNEDRVLSRVLEYSYRWREFRMMNHASDEDATFKTSHFKARK